MKVEIQKSVANGQITAPPSKSMAHRLLIAAALADGVSTVRVISKCEDVLATIDCLTSLGSKFEIRGEDIIVYGCNMQNANFTSTLFCRESGSTLRFLIPIALLSNNKIIFEGAESLLSRPMTVYENLSVQKGFDFYKNENKIIVCGPLKSGVYELPGNVSSQFVSGLLFALPLLKEDSVIKLTTLVESRSYIDLTISALREFGVVIDWADTQTLKIKGGQSYNPAEVTVEGDASGAAFIEAFNFFGGNVVVDGMNANSLQGDNVYKELFSKLDTGSATVSIADCPDLAPILFAVAAAKHGGTFLDTKRLKIKESDRAEVMAEQLRKFGTKVIVNENSVEIIPEKFHAPNSMLCGYNDHRIVMALSVLLTLTGGVIDDAQAVAKSYPTFFEDLKRLGIEVKEK